MRVVRRRRVVEHVVDVLVGQSPAASTVRLRRGISRISGRQRPNRPKAESSSALSASHGAGLAQRVVAKKPPLLVADTITAWKETTWQ
jgi:hypothetical protein